MDKKVNQLKELFLKANPVTTDPTGQEFRIVLGFDVKISTDTPTRENEISFDSVRDAVDTIFKAEYLTNKSKTDTEKEFIEICQNSNIDPEKNVTIHFLLSGL